MEKNKQIDNMKQIKTLVGQALIFIADQIYLNIKDIKSEELITLYFNELNNGLEGMSEEFMNVLKALIKPPEKIN